MAKDHITDEVEWGINRNIYTAYDVIGEIVYLDEGIYKNHVGELSIIEVYIVSYPGHKDDDFTLNALVQYVEDVDFVPNDVFLG